MDKMMDKKTRRRQNNKIARYYTELLEIQLQQETTVLRRFRIQAELEDIAEGHWNGPRLDLPPEGWE
jgi:hypothetical protein